MPDFARGLEKAHRLGWRDWQAMARASQALWRANRRLRKTTVSDLVETTRQDELRAKSAGTGSDEAAADTVQRVSLAVPRAARLVPWRSDCLVQALAAQDLLAREGITTDLHFGVDGEAARGIEAHAWLSWRNVTVTGGDIERFSRFE